MASLEDLIPIVNKLQDVMYDAGIDTLDLPILAVVGSQSSGKSSILETLVGKDFLPRGTGIVTRRPLVLQLNNISEDSPLIYEYDEQVSSNNDDNDDDNDSNDQNEEREITLEEHLRKNISTYKPEVKNEWGEFLHIPGKRFYKFDDIRKEIERETSRIAGKNKGISRIPINLKVFSPHVLNLTLVDLPGITKVPIGEQPPDIERQIKNLILEYIAKPNCIVLAVSPANVDLVNSESLKLARDVDPLGKRTIGIVTKLDLMDPGTNALDILSGKVYPLKLGFVGVVNRSQQDIQLNKSVGESLKSEQEFFDRHPVYRAISNRCGTRYLAKLLNQILINHIREKLPDIKARLNTLISQTEQELEMFGGVDIITRENRASLVLQLMNKFAKNFIASIEGTSSEISTKELCGGARIYYIYNNIFRKSLNSIDPTSSLSIREIRTAIRNSTGPRPSLFVPELAFDLLVKPQITLLLDPSQVCVELVYEELTKICHSCGSPELTRYPKLQVRLVEVVSELLRERLGPTRSYVESLIDIHRAYINTNHPNFISATVAMSQIVEDRKKQRQAAERKIKDEDRKRTQTESSKNPTGERSDSIDNNSNASDLDDASDPPQLPTADDQKPPKDSFLNYFFGKDQQKSQTNSNLSRTTLTGYEDYNRNSTFGMESLDLSLRKDDDDGEYQLTEREELECELIRRLIVSYFGIIREMIEDQIPKAIMCLLVNYSKEIVQNRLVTKLYKDEYFDELLMEDQTLAQERERYIALLKTYKEAANIISDI
ncbi:probable Dynamin-related protein DNM1 [Saccharomycodes ludwigii]|uniref:dynamin GTPase n=1 Tax=Saccharomycodes ludwigii TaxID=36035 RepID=A0A376B9P1_9ASCO|nr:hypothetical protein SCDLUD_004675 [Saccharomycodes ludwigii]KAH3899242.1 hypothetical protein SCDLUD_004675 [Saccharomycodes ludwigii]SSD61408.1 probable Dynamin-related protein DNM1 [Saccharomycodes ludwigii]